MIYVEPSRLRVRTMMIEKNEGNKSPPKEIIRAASIAAPFMCKKGNC